MPYDTQNVFGKILRGEIPCTPVYEDEHVLAFLDIAPQAPVHVLVIPKCEAISFDDFVTKPPSDVIAFFTAVRTVAHHLGLQESGYRLVMNHGDDGGQEVAHFHVHILGGKI
ncbi:MAG: histidine triad nucleotide-binding protein [Alphaproteobacteria bacterium]|nr:MAG: histidine triad nucleotide-binding protein [Alphaproteobacteria bacterium]